MPQDVLENPVMVGVCGLVLVVAAALFWTQTGTRVALYVAGGAAAVTLILVMVGIQVETDRERIQRTIDEVATALSRNDYERVYNYIHPGAAAGVARAQAELPNYKFSEARVTRMKSIVVNRNSPPPTAIAEFNVAVTIEFQGQRIPVRRFVKAYFMLEGQRWLVSDYEHFEPTAAFKDEP